MEFAIALLFIMAFRCGFPALVTWFFETQVVPNEPQNQERVEQPKINPSNEEKIRALRIELAKLRSGVK